MLTTLTNFNSDNISFNVIEKTYKYIKTKTNYYDIKISILHDNVLTDLLVPLKNVYTFGIQNTVDLESKKYQIPLCLYDLDKNPYDQDFLTINSVIVRKCEDYINELINCTEYVNIKNMLSEEDCNLNPFYKKDKLFIQLGFIQTLFYDNSGSLIDIKKYLNTSFYLNTIIKFDSIYICKGIVTLRLKLYEAEILDTLMTKSFTLTYEKISLDKVKLYNKFKSRTKNDLIDNFPWDIAPTMLSGSSVLYNLGVIDDFNDYDFYIYNSTEDQVILWIKKVLKYLSSKGYYCYIDEDKKYDVKLPIITSNAITLFSTDYDKKPVQLIYKFYNAKNVPSIINTFDLECNRVAFDKENEYYGKNALNSILSREIIFDLSNPKYELYTSFILYLMRLNKYVNRNFTISISSNTNYKGLKYTDIADILRKGNSKITEDPNKRVNLESYLEHLTKEGDIDNYNFISQNNDFPFPTLKLFNSLKNLISCK